MSARDDAILGCEQPVSDRTGKVRVLVFLQGTVLMHSGAQGHSRDERVAQSRDGTDPSLRDAASYVPVGAAPAKLRGWREQGAHIDYLTSDRDPSKVAQNQAVLARYGFPKGRVLARRPDESYGQVAAREAPDVLIEDDCESIGADEITYAQIRPDLRARIRSIVVPEFGGIDHLPDSLDRLLQLSR